MSADRIQDLLMEADRAAARHVGAPPSLADLERRHRLVMLRRGGGLLLAAAAAAALWLPWIQARNGPEGARHAVARLTRSLGELESALASLRPPAPVVPSASSEGAALDTFRALHRGAALGDAGSVEGMRWLAEHFPSTRGGRCARLFLEEAPGLASASTAPRGGTLSTETDSDSR